MHRPRGKLRRGQESAISPETPLWPYISSLRRRLAGGGGCIRASRITRSTAISQSCSSATNVHGTPAVYGKCPATLESGAAANPRMAAFCVRRARWSEVTGQRLPRGRTRIRAEKPIREANVQHSIHLGRRRRPSPGLGAPDKNAHSPRRTRATLRISQLSEANVRRGRKKVHTGHLFDRVRQASHWKCREDNLGSSLYFATYLHLAIHASCQISTTT